MTYNPDTDPEVLALRQRAREAETEAQAKADRFLKDDQLACAKGKSPEQLEARKRVAALFCELHLPGKTPEEISALLARIDYEMTVTTTNGRGIDMENPKGTGLLGFRRKPAYLVSTAHPPHDDQHPIYVLEYFARES